MIKILITDFDGVMTDNKVLVDEKGKEAVYCHRKDGLGIRLLREKGIETIVVTMEENSVVTERCNKLKIGCFQGVYNKAAFITNLLKKLGYKWQEIAYIGDSVIDKESIKKAGLGMAVLDAEPEIHYVADYIVPIKGGQGVLREAARFILCRNNQS